MGFKPQLLIAMLVVAITSTVQVVVVDAAAVDIATPEFFNGILNQATGSNCPGKTFYTHEHFKQAIERAYPNFGILGSDQDSRREVAAFFAHVSHETGSMCYVRENNDRSEHCKESKEFPCVQGRKYFGRGPLQLSWNYNYKPCGEALKVDILSDPWKVAEWPVLTWKTALWVWMTKARPVLLTQGFGATIRKINGMECDGKNLAAVQSRVQYYNAYCQKFGIPTEPKPGC